MSVKFGPLCVACLDGHDVVTDVVSDEAPSVACRRCGDPRGSVYVDPYGECECELCSSSVAAAIVERDAWERGVDPEHFDSEDRWLELFGVS